MENVVTFVTTKQKGMENKTVKFRVEMEHPLPIDGETCTITFIGRAEIDAKKMSIDEGGGEMLNAEITDLWFGVEVHLKEVFSWNFKAVSVTEMYKTAYQPTRKILEMLESAAVDAYHIPEAITLPDEKCNPLTSLVSFLKPHPIVS